jgi:hypothetical protein
MQYLAANPPAPGPWVWRCGLGLRWCCEFDGHPVRQDLAKRRVDCGVDREPRS